MGKLKKAYQLLKENQLFVLLVVFSLLLFVLHNDQFLKDNQLLLTALIGVVGTFYTAKYSFSEIKKRKEVEIRYDLWTKAKELMFNFQKALERVDGLVDMFETSKLWPNSDSNNTNAIFEIWKEKEPKDLVTGYITPLENAWSELLTFLFMTNGVFPSQNSLKEKYYQLRPLLLLMTIALNHLKTLDENSESLIKQTLVKLDELEEEVKNSSKSMEQNTLGEILN